LKKKNCKKTSLKVSDESCHIQKLLDTITGREINKDLQTENQSLKKDNQIHLDKQLNDERVEKLEVELQKLKEDLTQSREINKDLQTENQSLKSQVESLKLKLEAADAAAADAKEDITKCSICLVDNSEEQQKIIEELKIQAEKLKFESSKVEGLKVEIVRLKSVIDELGESKSSMQDKMIEKDLKISKLNEKIKEKDLKSDERVAQLRQQLDEQIQKNVQLHSELLGLKHRTDEKTKCPQEEEEEDKKNETLNIESSDEEVEMVNNSCMVDIPSPKHMADEETKCPQEEEEEEEDKENETLNSESSYEVVEMVNNSCMVDLPSPKEETPVKISKKSTKGKTPRRLLEPQEGDEERDRFLRDTMNIVNTDSWSSRLRRKR